MEGEESHAQAREETWTRSRRDSGYSLSPVIPLEGADLFLHCYIRRLGRAIVSEV